MTVQLVPCKLDSFALTLMFEENNLLIMWAVEFCSCKPSTTNIFVKDIMETQR